MAGKESRSSSMSSGSSGSSGSSSGLSSGLKLGKDRYQIVVMGAAAVGKSALIARFFYGTFPTTHKATVEDMHSLEYKVTADEMLRFEVIDTSGTLQFPAMKHLSIQNGDGFVLVYSVASAESFEEVRRLREEIVSVRGPAVPIVVVGNKADLEERREVNKITAETIATIDWEHGFVEASALHEVNVVLIFQELLKQSKIQLDLVVARDANERRRQSYPLCHTHRNRDYHGKKRHSCAVS